MPRLALISLVLLAAFPEVALAKPRDNVLRPNDMDVGTAMGEAKCTPESLKGASSPYTAAWSDGQRADVETGLRQGIVVVKNTCAGVEILTGCTVSGDYPYAGVSPKHRTLEMKDAGAAQANFGSMFTPARFSAAWEQGRVLSLAYNMVGTATTTTHTVDDSMLEGRCEGATHFIHRIYLGAFSLDSSAAGAAKAELGVTGYGGASGHAEASKAQFSTDGDLNACVGASETDASPVTSCGAVVRVELYPVDFLNDDFVYEELDSRSCPIGYVWADDACLPLDEAPSFLCDADDLPGCKAQCLKGSAESCGRYATQILDAYVVQTNSGPGISSSKAKDIGKDLAPVQEALVTACYNEEADACAAASLGVVTAQGRMTPEGLEFSDYLALIERGCLGTNAWACKEVAYTWLDGLYEDDEDLFSPKADLDKGLKILDTACERGSAPACSYLAEEYGFSGNLDEKLSAAERAAGTMKYLGRACEGGIADACFVAGIAWQEEKACQAVVKRISKKEGTGPLMTSLQDTEDFCPLVSKKTDAKKAKEFLDKGCKAKLQLACDENSKVK